MEQFNLYIDESGIADFLDCSYKHFLLAGVAVNASNAMNLEGYFNIIKRKYGLELSTPFHSYELFEDSKSSSHMELSEAIDFNSSIIEFIRLFPLSVKIFHANKDQFRKIDGLKSYEDFKGSKANKRKREFLYTLAATNMFYWFANILEEEEAYGNIIIESRKGLDKHLLYAYNNCKELQQRRSNVDRTNAELAKKRLHSISFTEKTLLTGGLEIVDLIAYAFFHKIDKKLRLSNYKDLKLEEIARTIKEECNNDCFDELKAENYHDLFNKKAN